jgi:uncharacterized protein YgbK (DUF1537 family)
MSGRLSKSRLFAALPPPWPGDLRSKIRAMVAARPDHKLVVLDDDPTGTQTVHDVAVLTTWDVDTLKREFKAPEPCFYILTNSRSLPAKEARSLALDLAENLKAAAGNSFTLISRSDSTLRGHFPLETDSLAQVLGPFDATILFPYFEEGGRYTIDDIHYVTDGDTLIPAADTPFAQDAAFGYRNSNLCDYVEEKTRGRVKANEVVSFSIRELRTAAPCLEPTRQVFARLQELGHQKTAIVNACAEADAECFALATLLAEKAGGRYLFRTAAQFVAARLGLEPQPLWQPNDEHPGNTGGLTVVGSYVPNTTEQLQRLLISCPSAITPIELSVPALLESDFSRAEAIMSTAQQVNKVLAVGRHVVLFTSRQLVTGPDAKASLDIGNTVSAALVEIVRRLGVRPRYIIAKGGVTSSDLATRGLGVKRAMVRGRLLPGVPAWELGAETTFRDMPYIVFPGNVGGPHALGEAVQKLSDCGLTTDFPPAISHQPSAIKSCI